VAYPVRGGDWLNVVVIAESAPAGDARDWDQSSSIAALKQAMGRSCGGLQALLDAMPGWRAWSLSDRAPMTSAADMAHERVALVGDAAHPMVPYLAQGAGMAIEDAVALADALGDGSAVDVPAAFARYARRAGRAMRRCRRGRGATARSSMRRAPCAWGATWRCACSGRSCSTSPGCTAAELAASNTFGVEDAGCFPPRMSPGRGLSFISLREAPGGLFRA
jgi:2-polyprenyl-6-methoxyphenol hydroxylase-like FAD-dependent oxidoreductase